MSEEAKSFIAMPKNVLEDDHDFIKVYIDREKVNAQFLKKKN